MFTMIASRSNKFLVGINTLLGGVLVVSTIVVGTITLNISYPLHVNPSIFLRDMAFLCTTLTIVAFSVWFNPGTLIASSLLLLCYAAYICLAFYRGEGDNTDYEHVGNTVVSNKKSIQDRRHSIIGGGEDGDEEEGDQCHRCMSQLDGWYELLEYPVRIIQHCTIPLLVDNESNQYLWRTFRWAYPVCVPSLLAVWLSTSDFASNMARYGSIALCLIIAVVLALCILYLPPPMETPILPMPSDRWGDFPGNGHRHSTLAHLQRISLFTWLFVAFCSCIIWIDLTANILVATLSLAGDRMGIPREFLGLTVLAWGNSVGDCITDNALARQGRGLMALSGCYGGPLFNVLVGLGIAVLLNAISGGTFVFSAEDQDGIRSIWTAEYAVQSLLLSIVFLYVVFLTTTAMVHYSDYVLTGHTGLALICLYLCYSACQCALLYVERES